MNSLAFTLTLDKMASKNGGDKYIMQPTAPIAGSSDRERSIYVSQKVSRQLGSCASTLDMTVLDSDSESAPTDISFRCVKLAKGAGDDRYTPDNPDQWAGDIYMPRALGGKVGAHIYLSFSTLRELCPLSEDILVADSEAGLIISE